MLKFKEVYDGSLRWSGFVSSRLHLAALSYWLLALVVVTALSGLIRLAGRGEADVAEAFAFAMSILGAPFGIMLFLSTVRRGRGAGVPGWLTAAMIIILPVLAVVYAFLPNKGEAADGLK
ncbi:MAG: hypothetical protein KA744_04820 [Phenylobacterium sp.]|nr:hypothetical protein [Phenylobacterium sp.]MBP9756108.1 hypothetical protein [Phenylobacterium sp.]